MYLFSLFNFRSKLVNQNNNFEKKKHLKIFRLLGGAHTCDPWNEISSNFNEVQL